ncbi:MAG: BrnA antitoxin family protein [Syntrophobacteraceae bacterium]|jgi:uncharacterized protein (DUF4415 family)
MSKKSTLRGSQTEWGRIKAMRDEDIDTSEIPEITEEQMKGSTLRFGGKHVSKGKMRVNILLDAEVVAYFKSQAGGRGYQTLINEALKASMRDRDLESTIRRIIREELGASG